MERFLFDSQEAYAARSPEIHVVSAVGADDSFLRGIIWSLASGGDMTDAFRYGVAAGSAAVLNVGTELCHAEDTARLYDQIQLIILHLSDGGYSTKVLAAGEALRVRLAAQSLNAKTQAQ